MGSKPWELPRVFCKLQSLSVNVRFFSAAVYDSAPGVCDFSYGSNCVYINSAANVYEWNKETTTTYITTDLPSFHNGRCIAGFYDGVHASADVPNPIVNKEPLPKFSLGSGIARRRRGTAQVELAHFKKSTDRQPNLDRVRRSCFRIAGKNVGVTPTKSTSTVLTANKVVSNEVFEVGKFVKHVSNSYIKFTFTASEGLGYYFYCYAHCLPDPLGILDQVGSVEESRSHETFRLFSTSSVGSHTVCLNLKDSVGCGEFAMRFSATILHLSSQAARLSFTPKGVYSSLAQAGCTSQCVYKSFSYENTVT